MMKYVAFNPASSETSEFVEGNSLRDILDDLNTRGYLSGLSYAEDREHLKKINNGIWRVESIEIYQLKYHPKLKEEVKSWKIKI